MTVGINLKKDGETKVAILGDGTKIISAESNKDIVDALDSNSNIIAINAPLIKSDGLSDKEEELIDEGYSFSPSTHNKVLHRRALHLKQLLFEEGVEAEVIRFDPMITSQELAIDGDQALNSYGVSSSDIDNADEFDAVLGAITARFYEQNQCQDYGVQVPTPLRNDED